MGNLKPDAAYQSNILHAWILETMLMQQPELRLLDIPLNFTQLMA